MKNVSYKSCGEKQNTYFMFNNFFKKKVPLLGNLKKYCRAGLARDGALALHAG
jgi:hypothetical protein